MPQTILIAGRSFTRFETPDDWLEYAFQRQIAETEVDSVSFPCLVYFELDENERPIPFFFDSENLSALSDALRNAA